MTLAYCRLCFCSFLFAAVLTFFHNSTFFLALDGHKQAYVMHYNSARFYTELKDRSLSRFGIAVSSSFGLSAILYMAIASFGYLTFGGNCSGYILNNYSPYDPLAFVSRIAVGLAVLVRTTIILYNCRVDIYSEDSTSCISWLNINLI